MSYNVIFRGDTPYLWISKRNEIINRLKENDCYSILTDPEPTMIIDYPKPNPPNENKDDPLEYNKQLNKYYDSLFTYNSILEQKRNLLEEYYKKKAKALKILGLSIDSKAKQFAQYESCGGEPIKVLEKLDKLFMNLCSKQLLVDLVTNITISNNQSFKSYYNYFNDLLDAIRASDDIDKPKLDAEVSTDDLSDLWKLILLLCGLYRNKKRWNQFEKIVNACKRQSLNFNETVSKLIEFEEEILSGINTNRNNKKCSNYTKCCFRCGEPNHIVKDCPMQWSKTHCDFCDKNGHTVQACRNKKKTL